MLIFFVLCVVPDYTEFTVLNVEENDIIFIVIFHLEDQNDFISSFLEQKSYSFRFLTIFRLIFFWFVVVTADAELFLSLFFRFFLNVII